MSRRTRIALVITELNVGGAERAVASLALGLDRQEFEVTVYSLASRPAAGQRELVSQLEQAGVAVHFLAARRSWQLPLIVWRLRRLLKQQRPRVVLSFLYHANVIGGLAVAGLPEAPAHVASVRVAEPRAWRLRLEGPLLRRAQAVTCVSEMLAEHVSGRQRVPREQITVIPNGVEVDRFARAEPADLRSVGIEPDRRLLTAIGRLDRQKGFDWLLSGIDDLLEKLPQFDLLIVGEGAQRAELERQARRCRTSERIHLIGQRSDIPAILRRSELFLLPSRYEGMPNVVLEAMAAGLPVIARKVEGIAELLGTDDPWQVAASDEVTDYCTMVYELASDREPRHQWGAANGQRVVEHFAISTMIDAYGQVLRSASTRAKKNSP